MDEFPFLLLGAFVLIVLLAGRQFLRQRRQDAINDAAPLRSILVVVKNKREFSRTRRRSREHQIAMSEDIRYEATFHPVYGGAELTLRLTHAEYHQIDKGSQGTLQVKGTRFVSFAPRAS